MVFLQYIEASFIEILIVISFLISLSISEVVFAKILRASLVGLFSFECSMGYLWRMLCPLNIKIRSWWLEGTTRSITKASAVSAVAALSGIICPIGLPYLVLYLGFGYGAVETFIVSAAPSSTSLETTFAVLSATSIDFSETVVGTVLVTAAVIDDVVALLMSSVIQKLGRAAEFTTSINLGGLIGRPILASILMATITPLLPKFILAPYYHNFLKCQIEEIGYVSNFVVIVLVLSAFISVAAFSGTSILFGAYVSGLFLAYLSTKPTSDIELVVNEDQQPSEEVAVIFADTFDLYLIHIQQYLLAPLFFASIGFSVPFLELWTRKAIWHGVVYTMLMLICKAVVGLCISTWSLFNFCWIGKPPKASQDETRLKPTWQSALLLGSAMIARGEIGMLIVQVGCNQTSYVSQAAFTTAIWAILLNTIIGPISVGILVKGYGESITAGTWGLDKRR